MVKRLTLTRRDPGSIPDAVTLEYEFYCLVSNVFASLTNGPGFDPQQECLFMKEIGKILSTFGHRDGRLSRSSRGMTYMLYILHTVRTAYRVQSAGVIYCILYVQHTACSRLATCTAWLAAADRLHVVKNISL